MPSFRQEALAEAIAKNQLLPRDKRKNKTELSESVGYAPTTAEDQQHRIFNSKGVKEALRKYGLTEQLITESLVEDIKAKPAKREKELKLGAEILGMTRSDEEPDKPQVTINVNQYLTKIYGNNGGESPRELP